MENNEFIGKRIAFCRNKNRYTQEDLARHLGLSRTSLSNIEAGRQSLQMDHLISLCRLFCCSADEIIGITKPVSSEIRAENTALKSQMQRILEICEETT